MFQPGTPITASEWNVLTATLLERLLNHTHTGNTEEIPDGAQLSGSALVNESIENRHLVDAAVDTRVLAEQSVDESILAPDSVDDSHILDGSIRTEHPRDEAVTKEKIDPSVFAGIGGNGGPSTMGFIFPVHPQRFLVRKNIAIPESGWDVEAEYPNGPKSGATTPWWDAAAAGRGYINRFYPQVVWHPKDSDSFQVLPDWYDDTTSIDRNPFERIGLLRTVLNQQPSLDQAKLILVLLVDIATAVQALSDFDSSPFGGSKFEASDSSKSKKIAEKAQEALVDIAQAVFKWANDHYYYSDQSEDVFFNTFEALFGGELPGMLAPHTQLRNYYLAWLQRDEKETVKGIAGLLAKTKSGKPSVVHGGKSVSLEDGIYGVEMSDALWETGALVEMVAMGHQGGSDVALGYGVKSAGLAMEIASDPGMTGYAAEVMAGNPLYATLPEVDPHAGKGGIYASSSQAKKSVSSGGVAVVEHQEKKGRGTKSNDDEAAKEEAAKKSMTAEAKKKAREEQEAAEKEAAEKELKETGTKGKGNSVLWEGCRLGEFGKGSYSW